VSITFIENSGSNSEHTFLPNDPALLTRLPDPLVAEDFHGVATELYDVFYSDADGTLNNDGAYVTIEAVWDQQAPSGGGLNISEVRLDGSTESRYASVVSSEVYLGDNSIPGSGALSVDGNLATDSTMGNTVGQGNQRLRITLGFPPVGALLALAIPSLRTWGVLAIALLLVAVAERSFKWRASSC
jgi:hypothetical protein